MKPETAVAAEAQPEIEIISDAQPEVLLKENGRAKFTINLQSIFKNNPKPESKTDEENRVVTSRPDKPVTESDLKIFWQQFAELRKGQHAEYQLLKREFVFQNSVITIPLSNPIEEPLLQNIRVQLTSYLRDKLNNASISVVGVLEEITSKKTIYTNKEKFDHLAEKNPVLRELKDRLGLDTDF